MGPGCRKLRLQSPTLRACLGPLPRQSVRADRTSKSHGHSSCNLCSSVDTGPELTSTAIESTMMGTTASSAAAIVAPATAIATDASGASCDNSDETFAQIAAGYGFNLARCELALVHCPDGPFALTVLMNAMSIHCRRACALCDGDDSTTVETTEAATAGTSAPRETSTTSPPALVCRGGRTDNADLCSHRVRGIGPEGDRPGQLQPPLPMRVVPTTLQNSAHCRGTCDSAQIN